MVAAVGAQVSKKGNAYLFRMKFVKGKTSSFTIKTETATGVAASIPVKEKVMELSKDGKTAHLVIIMSPPNITNNGKPIPGSVAPAARIPRKASAEIDTRGHVSSGDGQSSSSQTNIVFPEKPITVGTTWSDTASVPMGTGAPMEVTQTYKFVGFETVKGTKTAKLALTTHGAGQMTMNGTGTAWVDMADGSILKIASKMSVVMGSMTVPTTVTVTRN